MKTYYHERENAVPMSVIEEIKAEIRAKACEHLKCVVDHRGPEDGLYEALNIIDEHIVERSNDAKDSY